MSDFEYAVRSNIHKEFIKVICVTYLVIQLRTFSLWNYFALFKADKIFYVLLTST